MEEEYSVKKPRPTESLERRPPKDSMRPALNSAGLRHAWRKGTRRFCDLLKQYAYVFIRQFKTIGTEEGFSGL
jgi:hypothetical protein